LPEELEGIKNLWTFILTSENEEATEKAIDFLNKLYFHIDSELDEKTVYIRSEYLKTAFSSLKSILAQKDTLKKEVFDEKC